MQPGRRYQSFPLARIMDNLGVLVAFDKCQEPMTTLTWIGVGYDSVKMLMFIDPDKIAEAITLCTQFLASDTISHRQLQKLLGEIFYVIRCTEAAKQT